MADEEKREVNFEETIHLPDEDVDPNEEDVEVAQEKETPTQSSEEENQTDSNGAEEALAEETPKEEEAAEEPEKEPVVIKAPEKEPKPVEGETPRERALRLEASRLKKLLRDERGTKMFGGDKQAEQPPAVDKEDEEFLKQYDQKEINDFEKIIDVIAKKKGWVRKEEFQTNTYQSQASEVLDTFLESHPEYLPENDKDNLLWGRFQQEFSLYKRPNNPRDLKRIFSKVHSEVFGITQGANTKQINAQKEKIKVASHAGAAPGGPKTNQPKPNMDPSLGEYLKGFSDDEKKEILGA